MYDYCMDKTLGFECVQPKVYGERQCGYCLNYQAGYHNAHYPVPAILTDVIITRDLVSICEYHAEYLSYQFICKA